MRFVSGISNQAEFVVHVLKLDPDANIRSVAKFNESKLMSVLLPQAVLNSLVLSIQFKRFDLCK